MMTTANKILSIFTFQQGNWRARIETTIEETKIYEGESFACTALKMGCHWQGDQCFFPHGSYIVFPDLEVGK